MIKISGLTPDGVRLLAVVVQDDEGTVIIDGKYGRIPGILKTQLHKGIKFKGNVYVDGTFMDGVKLIYNRPPYTMVKEEEIK